MSHYEILGLPTSASQQDIKTAYRKLVKQFHPDKNSSPEAKQMITLVNEAYEVLSDPVKRSRYDNRYTYLFKETAYEEDPREIYKREYLRKKKEEARKKKEYELELEKRAFEVMRYITFPILIFAIIMIIDFYLPPSIYHEAAEMGWQKIIGKGGETIISYMQTRNFKFVVPNEFHVSYDYYGDKKVLDIHVTPILRTVKIICVKAEDTMKCHPVKLTIYSWTPLPFILLVTSLFTIIKKSYSPIKLYLSCVPATIVLLMIFFRIIVFFS